MKPNIGQGDSGKSFLFGGGKKIFKDNIQFETLGVLDELNSFIGFSIAIGSNKQINEILKNIQNSLFTMGAVLATEKEYKKHKMIPNFPKNKIAELENIIQKYEKDVPELKNFILPGGAQQAAVLQICRALSRRAERRIVTLSKKRNKNTHIQAYLNRLSDVFFALARYVNHKEGKPETIWKSDK